MISNFSHIVSIEHQVPWPTAVDLPLSLGTASQDTAQRVLLRLTRTYSSLLICIALVLFASCYSTRHSLKQTRLGPREVKGTVPLLSHVIGLVVDPFEYPKTLAKRPGASAEPIFTIPLFSRKIHVTTSPELCQSALRHRNLTFDPWVRSFCKTVLRCSDKTLELMTPRHHTEMEGYNKDLYRAIHQNLADTTVLQDINSRALFRVASHLSTLAFDEDMAPTFYSWVTDLLTDAMATALYGDDNPMSTHPELREQFWTLEEHTTDLLVTPFPRLTVPKAYKAREALQTAFQEYLTSDQATKASVMIRARIEVDSKYKVPVHDSAGLIGVALFSAAVSNTHALLYWLIAYAFHDAELLASLRAELEPLVSRDESSGTAVLDTSRLATDCPLFKSMYAETARTVCVGTSIREVIADTTLSTKDGRDFFLQKGSMVQIPAGISHRLPQVWEAPDEFRPRRFMEAGSDDKMRKQAFHPFGGGKHLCPGRYLTFGLLQGIVATLVLGFEITDLEGEPLRVPDKKGDYTAAVLKPTKAERQNYQVRIRRRSGWESVTWRHRVEKGRASVGI